MAVAIAFIVVLGLLAVFQLALVFGAPLGKFAWGGQHKGKLPVGFRVGSLVSIVIYAVMALLALDRVSAVDVVGDVVSQVGMWVVFGYLAVGILMNAISRSKPERFTMTPVSLVLAVLAFFIALG